MSARPASAARLLAADFATCVLLLIQFLLGMTANLFTKIPDRHPGAGSGDYFAGAAAGLAWVVAHGPGWVAVHAAFGLALIAQVSVVVVLARRHGTRADLAVAVVGALAVVGAGFNGISFLNYGHDFSSMIMAALWAVALGCYLTGLLLVARRALHEPEDAPTDPR